MKSRTLLILLTLTVVIRLQAQLPDAIDSAKRLARRYVSGKEFISTCFFVADSYMEVEQYDSAQVWLNEIYAQLPAKGNSLSNYFLITRQAEVYYYNNLQQLGLQESRRGLAMAKVLNDSLLMADSYNFLGLFYMNIDSAEQSVQFYKKGLPFAKQPPYSSKYLSLSMPHHLYGNMAEAYLKLKNYDSAILYNHLSLQKASEINWQRGIAVAYSGLGDVYLAMSNYDSAITNYSNSIKFSKTSGDIDVMLVGYGGLGKSYFERKTSTEAKNALALGFDLLGQNPNINRFYALNFLSNAIDVYKKQNADGDLIKALEIKSKIEKANVDGNNKQIQTILNAGMANETKILSLQIEEAKRKQELANSRLWLALIGMALLAAGFLVYRYYQNQRLAVSRIRHKISQDLHDDIGASISSLQIYGAVAEKSIHTDPQKVAEMLQKINIQSKDILENMGDIVWSMKRNSTGGTSLEVKVKNYASELLQEKNIEFACVIQPDAEAALESMKARRNILLIIREILNNTVKYSKAAKAMMHIYIQDKNWLIEIGDNGIGFNPQQSQSGNGLKNIQNRTAELKGTYTVSSDAGTKYMFVFPLAVISDTGW